jgi:predicted transcriptional regulator
MAEPVLFVDPSGKAAINADALMGAAINLLFKTTDPAAMDAEKVAAELGRVHGSLLDIAAKLIGKDPARSARQAKAQVTSKPAVGTASAAAVLSTNASALRPASTVARIGPVSSPSARKAAAAPSTVPAVVPVVVSAPVAEAKSLVKKAASGAARTSPSIEAAPKSAVATETRVVVKEAPKPSPKAAAKAEAKSARKQAPKRSAKSAPKQIVLPLAEPAAATVQAPASAPPKAEAAVPHKREVIKSKKPLADIFDLVQSMPAAAQPEPPRRRQSDMPAEAPKVLPRRLSKLEDALRMDRIICLEDGKAVEDLGKHLALMGMTPAQYLEKWNLPDSYPMKAPTLIRNKGVAFEFDPVNRRLIRV